MSLSDRKKRRDELKNEVKNNQNSSKTSTIGGTYSSSRSQKRAAMKQEIQQERLSTVSSELSSRIDTWFKNNENYINNYNSRFSGVTGSYTDPYDAGIKDWERTVKRQNLNFFAEAASIKSIIEENKDYLNPDWANEVLSAFDNALRVQRDIVNNSSERAKYFSNWDSEESYKRYQTISSIADMTSEQIKQYLGSDDPVAFTTDDGKEVTWDYLYKTKFYEELMSGEDFEEYSKLGASVKNPSYAAANGSDNFLGWKNPFAKGEEIGNIVTFSRDNIEDITKAMSGANSNADLADVIGDYRYQYMTDDEVAIYNYYLGKGDTEKAAEYLADLDEALNARWGEKIADRADSNIVSKLVFGLGAGLDQFVSGAQNIKNFITGGEAVATTPTQFASSIIREDLGTIGGVAYDLAQTTGNMLPSILVGGLAGSVAGTATMGVSAAGNGYNEMRKLGYDEWQARGYGLLVGASEATLQYALGGISKLGGKVTNNAISNLVSKFDNAIARVAIDLGGNMLAEGLEEAVQSVLEPAFKSLMTGEGYNVDWEEVFYSGLLGALSAGLLEGAPTIAGTASNSNAANKIYGDNVQDLVTESLEIDPENAHAQRMQARLDSDKNVSGYQLNRLAEANESTMLNNDVSAIKTAAANRLTELGESGNVDVIASALTKQVTGESLTLSEKKAIKSSEYAQRVANELNPENIRSGGYSSAWAEKIGTDRINAAEYGKMIAELEHDATDPKFATNIVSPPDEPKEKETEETSETVSKVAQKPTVASEGLTEAREEKGVEADGDKATFKLSNGETVASDKVAFKSEDAKLVADTATERVSRVEGFTNETATAMIKGYDGSVSAAKYITLFDEAYNMGATDKPSSALVKVMNLGISESVAHTAYVLGKESSKNAESVLNSEAKNGIINNNINESEAGYESGENLHLRNSGERVGSQNTQGQVPRMESGAGQAESRGKAARIADSEAARLVNEGREVKVADLGILGGSNVHTVRLVDQANETSSMKEARKNAEARGLKVKFFVGDSLIIKDKNGHWFAANAYIKGEHVLVRADHSKYTSDQLMRHELGHDMIAKGEVDIDAVRERLIETVGKDKIDEVAKAYSDAYVGSGLSAEEIWEECICDSLGDMNIFAGNNVVNDILMEDMIPEINKAANETKSPTQTRGSPEGKASRDANRYTEKEYRDFGWARANDVISASESEDLRSKFAAIVSEQAVAPQTKSGEYMIAIGEDVNNKIAYMTGTITDPVITRVLEIDEYNETKLDEKRRETYALEGQGIQRKTGGIFNVNTSASFGGTDHQQRSSRQGERHNNRLNSQRSRSEIKANPITRTQVNEDENTVTYTYKNGETVTESLGKASRELDTEYLSAVNRGDMETAQKMVDEAAKAAGYTVKAYHGTNSEFTVFDWSKTQRADAGFYGRGHYFATRKGEAGMYGKRVIPVALKNPKPFNFDSEMHTVNGVYLRQGPSSNVLTDSISFAINMAEKFPNIFDKNTFSAYSTQENTGVELRWKEISKMLDDFMQSKDFYIIQYNDGHYEWYYKKPGYWGEYYTHNDYQTKDEAEKDKIGAAINILFGKVYQMSTPLDDAAYYLGGDMNASDAFTEELKRQGYTGVIQAENGDEIVIFDSENIKDASPVTYDDNGNVIPLSERFNAENDDIRYSRELDYVDYLEQQTDREVLANAFESVAQNDVEKAKLKDYRDNIGKLNAEEEKLKKLRAEIKELSFGKGPRDLTKIAQLREEAEKTANRIGIYDKRLLTLEASKPLRAVLEREKQKSYNRAKAEARADLDAYRARALVKQEELKTRYQESKKRGVEGRRKTELRHKIKGTMGELNNLLLHGSKNRNVKLGLQEAVAAALEAINIDTVGVDENGISIREKRLAEINQKLAAEKDPFEINRLLEAYNRYMKQDKTFKDNLEAMRKAYEDIRENNDPNNPYPDYYKAEAALIEKRVKSVVEKVGDTPIRNMTLEQLQEVYDLYKMVLTTVRNANTVFIKGKMEDLIQNVNAFAEDLSKVPKLPEERLKMLDKARALEWNEYIPYYAFTRIGSKNFEKFYWAAIDGQDVYAKDTDEAKTFATEMRKKYHYDKWDLDKVHEFKLADGQVFKVTLKHMMSIYAYSKREQAAEHMRTGGFFFNDKATFRKNKGVLEMIRSSETGYKIDDNSLIAIVKALSEEQRKYVDEMQAYLTQMGEKGNEVTRVLWGINLFKEKVYFPLKSSTDFVYQANQPVQESSLKNDGMTKETKPGASNPIILEAFDDVWSTHVERMSQYHAYVLPIENLNKILNYGTWANTDAVAVTTMLRARFGSAAVDYFNRFIGDLNGVKGSKGAAIAFLGNMFTKFKKTAVAASFSVIVQQPTAILRAQAVIDPKYFVGQKVSDGKLKETWEEVKKHAPIAIIKEMGGYDAGGGRQAIDWMNADTKRGIDKVSSKVDDLTMRGAAWGDMLGWCTIWNAVKRETISKHHDLAPTSDEFFDIVYQRFNEVIVKTQVYDSTLSRSGYMRSDKELTKMATAFKGEPTLSTNILYDSVIQAKRGTITKGTAVRRIGAVYLATVAAAIAKSAIYALGDDDEDESYAEKYLQALGGTLNPLTGDIDPLTWLPGISDIISIFDGWDVERTDMAIFKDLKDAIDGLDSDSKSTWRKLEDFAGAVAAFFGQPLKNVMKSMRQIYNACENMFDGITGGKLGAAFLEGATGKGTDKSQSLYDAILAGDEARLAVYRDDYDDDFQSAIRKALHENDVRIKEAAKAFDNVDSATYEATIREIVGEGVFTQDDVLAAISSASRAFNTSISNAASLKLKGEEKKYEKMLKEIIKTYKGVYTREEIEAAVEIEMSKPQASTTESDKIKSKYSIEYFYKAVRNNKIADAYIAREDIIGAAVDNGKSQKAAESAFESSIASFVGDQYRDALIGDGEAKSMLTLYGGLTDDEARTRVRYWAFKLENPEYDDLSESAVNKYYDGSYKDGELYGKSAQSYGITLDVYAEYVREASGLSKKEDIMYIINTLPLSREQKDALYYLNGWAKSTIREAPWR